MLIIDQPLTTHSISPRTPQPQPPIPSPSLQAHPPTLAAMAAARVPRRARIVSAPASAIALSQRIVGSSLSSHIARSAFQSPVLPSHAPAATAAATAAAASATSGVSSGTVTDPAADRDATDATVACIEGSCKGVAAGRFSRPRFSLLVPAASIALTHPWPPLHHPLSAAPIPALVRFLSSSALAPQQLHSSGLSGNAGADSSSSSSSIIEALPPSVPRAVPDPGESLSARVDLAGSEVVFETGRLARLASGAVVVGVGDTKVLVTAVASHDRDTSRDFLPLMVDYRERQYVMGRIPNTYMRREGAPKEREILCARIIDRSIRPLFPKGFFYDTQITASVLSSDQEQDPDVLAVNAASAALCISDIPWNGPIGCVRVGRIDGQFVVNPSMTQLASSDLSLVYACTQEHAVMMEVQAREISNEDMAAALHLAHAEAAKLIPPQLELAEQARQEKRQAVPLVVTPAVMERVRGLAGGAVTAVLTNSLYSKVRGDLTCEAPWKPAGEEAGRAAGGDARSDGASEGAGRERCRGCAHQFCLLQGRGRALSKVQQDVAEVLGGGESGLAGEKVEGGGAEVEQEREGGDSALAQLPGAMEKLKREVIRDAVLGRGSRADGRGLEEVRQVACEAGVLNPLHGSSLFSRGNTQVLCTVTLGPPDDAQRVDSLTGVTQKRFMVHYSFPPFSVNEVRSERGGLNRREVGHGTLAEKALLAVFPDEQELPYSVRVTSEVMSSDGSSSMATVCGASLALMDAGVGVREHVAGISMGLVTDVDPSTGEIKDYRLLTDILGLEDYLGDMDFKIAGTRRGITAIQLDIKLPGVPLPVLCAALDPALTARSRIIEHMEKELAGPRLEHSATAPRFGTVAIDRDSIGRLIGPQGSTIKQLQRLTGSRIQVSNEGSVSIFARDSASFEATRDMGHGTPSIARPLSRALPLSPSLSFLPHPFSDTPRSPLSPTRAPLSDFSPSPTPPAPPSLLVQFF
ncbi:unnamed protein product [Closterium sp. Naga37s-1]|nr:unnamed protein product [Closterium sp. Naga37s-1]